ncbi:MAG: nucleoside deaminase [Candidatus Omnitrophota bacterium]
MKKYELAVSPHKKYMRLALKEAKKNLTRMHGGPFGACIVRGGKVIALGHNSVLTNDPTAHAEINAIRSAAKKLKSYDLSGCIIYSTTEPCPMCFSAIHWARIDGIVYGNAIADAKKIGFHELGISAKAMKRLGRSSVKVIGGFLLPECNRIFRSWALLANRVVY